MAIAAVLPILIEIFNINKTDWVSPAWATIALAISVLCITLDRYGGYTSGWVRYVRTGQKLINLQTNFKLEWEKIRHMHYTSELDINKIQEAIDLCKDFLKEVNNEIQLETNMWGQEFQKILSEIEQNPFIKKT